MNRIKIICVCIMAMCLSACDRLQATSDEDARKIESNLHQYWDACESYMLEHGKDEARYTDIVGPDKYITSINPIRGEDYTLLIRRVDTSELTVQTKDGRIITWKP